MECKKNKQNWNRFIDTENRLGARGEGVGGQSEKVKGCHRDVKYRVANVINNIIIIMYGARWVLEILGGHTLYILSNYCAVHL